jgi:hypothetical protein
MRVFRGLKAGIKRADFGEFNRAERRVARVCKASRHLLAAAGMMMMLAGCARPHTPYPESFNSFLPEDRILAAKHAADIHDRDAIPLLVDRLEDDDPAVRLFSILALEKLTGTRLGYDYGSDDLQRARAAQRWRRYLAEQAASQPVSASSIEPAPASAPACSQSGMVAGGVGQ